MSKQNSQTSNFRQIDKLPSGIFYNDRLSRRFGLALLVAYAIFSAWSVTSPSLQGSKHVIFVASIWSLGILYFLYISYTWGWEEDYRPRRYYTARDTFAAANGFRQLSNAEIRNLLPASMKLYDAHDRHARAYEVAIGRQSMALIDLKFKTGYGRNEQSYQFAIAVLTFTKSYPHIYLDAKHNSVHPRFSGSQKLQLEGDFNNFYTAYIPRGSSAGSLTILSPDIMAALIDTGGQLDIEIDASRVAIITDGFIFTRENFLANLLCGQTLFKEFSELNISWQPYLSKAGKQYQLKRGLFQREWLLYAMPLGFVALMILIQILMGL